MVSELLGPTGMRSNVPKRKPMVATYLFLLGCLALLLLLLPQSVSWLIQWAGWSRESSIAAAPKEMAVRTPSAGNQPEKPFSPPARGLKATSAGLVKQRAPGDLPKSAEEYTRAFRAALKLESGEQRWESWRSLGIPLSNEDYQEAEAAARARLDLHGLKREDRLRCNADRITSYFL